MKEIDDTDLPESESEWNFEAMYRRIRRLELRIANLETQRTPEMENDDPEWFS